MWMKKVKHTYDGYCKIFTLEDTFQQPILFTINNLSI